MSDNKNLKMASMKINIIRSLLSSFHFIVDGDGVCHAYSTGIEACLPAIHRDVKNKMPIWKSLGHDSQLEKSIVKFQRSKKSELNGRFSLLASEEDDDETIISYKLKRLSCSKDRKLMHLVILLESKNSMLSKVDIEKEASINTQSHKDSLILHKSNKSSLRFMFEYDPELDDFLGEFRKPTQKMNYTELRNHIVSKGMNGFLQKIGNKLMNKKNPIKNNTPLNGIAFVSSQASNIAKYLSKTNEMAKLDKDIQTMRLWNGKLIEAMHVDEEEELNVIREEEKAIFNRNGDKSLKGVKDNRVQDKDIDEVKIKTLTRREDILKHITKLRGKGYLFTLIGVTLIFVLFFIGTEIVYTYVVLTNFDSLFQVSMFQDSVYNLLNGLQETNMQMSRISLAKKNFSPSFLQTEQLMNYSTIRLIELHKLIETSNLNISNIGRLISWGSRLNYNEIFDSQNITMLYSGGASKSTTLRESGKQIEATILDLIQRGIDSIPSDDPSTYFAQMNTPGIIQKPLYEVTRIVFSIVEEGFTAISVIYLRFILTNTTLFLFLIIMVFLLRAIIKQIDSSIGLYYGFSRRVCDDFFKRCDFVLAKYQVDDQDDGSDMGIEIRHLNLQDATQIKGAQLDDDDDEFVLQTARKKNENIDNYITAPKLIILLIVISNAIVMNMFNFALLNAAGSQNEPLVLKAKILRGVDLFRLGVMGMLSAVDDYENKIWDKDRAYKLSLDMLKENEEAIFYLGQVITEYLSTSVEIKQLYDESYIKDTCEFLYTRNYSTTMSLVNRECNLLLDTSLTKVFRYLYLGTHSWIL